VSEARTEVMAAIRANLDANRGEPSPVTGPAPCTPTGLETAAARTTRFVEVLERTGGFVHVVSDEASTTRALAAIVEKLGAREVALSDAPLVRSLCAELKNVETFDGSRDRERLIDCDLGITAAQKGVAETGTLMLLSANERHRVTSLVPPVHVAILEAADILAGLGDALAAARDESGDLPNLVTFITGPSRTGDIELQLVVGVHGPKELHVVLLDR
jgi:L-lactate dehydrogenase complex protein LldG